MSEMDVLRNAFLIKGNIEMIEIHYKLQLGKETLLWPRIKMWFSDFKQDHQSIGKKALYSSHSHQ